MQEKEEKTVKPKKDNVLRRIVAWVTGILFAIVIIVPCLLYIPVIQEGVKNLATYFVNNNTSMTMEVGRISLQFPLKLNVRNTLILDENKDTIVFAGNALLDVDIRPIFRKRVNISNVEADEVVYNMFTEDSSMILRAKVNHFKLSDSDVNLSKCEVNLRNVLLKGGNVSMYLGESTSDTVPADTTSIPWIVNIGKFKVDNVAYKMQMLPLIENLETQITSATMTGGTINLGTQDVGIKYFGINKADVKYFYPTPEYMAEHPAVVDTIAYESEEEVSVPWTIKIDALRLSDSYALYAMSGAEPVEGLDMNYLELSDINIGVDSLYNRDSDIKLILSQLTGRERCGLFVTSGKGKLSMDSEQMSAEGLRLETMQSMLQLDGYMGLDMSVDAETPVSMNMLASIGVGELGRVSPSLNPMLENIPQYNPVKMVVDIKGNTKELNLRKALMEMPQYITVSADGRVNNVMEFEKLVADVEMSGEFKNMDFMKPIMLDDTTMYKQIDIPNLKLNGKVYYAPDIADALLDLRADSGYLALKGKWNGKSKEYSADFELDSFPLQAFLPTSGLEDITMRMHAKGAGYDVYDEKTRLEAGLAIDRLTYDNKIYRNVSAYAMLENAYLSLDLVSKNTNCAMDMTLSCMLNEDYYEFGVDGAITNLDLKSMRFSETMSKGKGKIAAYGTIDTANDSYQADVNLKDFEWNLEDAAYRTPAVVLSVASTPDSMSVYAYEEDMFLNFNTPVGLDTLLAGVSRCQEILDYEIENKYLDFDTLQGALPPMVCELRVGKSNLVQQALKSYGVKMKNLSLDLINDSTIYVQGKAQGLEAFAMKIDTLNINMNQRNKYLSYKFHAGSRPGTNDEFAQVTLFGGIRGNQLGMLLNQSNIKGEQGFRLGVNAFLGDTAVNVNFFPKNPIIGYRDWTVNENNLIAYNYIDNKFTADLNLKSDSSFVSLRTKQKTDKPGQDDVLFRVGGVQISEWLKVSPFMPHMSGILSSDVALKFHGKRLLGGGIMRLKDFKYNRKSAGDFAFKAFMALDPEKEFIRLKSSFDINGRSAIVVDGALNDTTSKNPFRLALKLDSFPLEVANPFIPGNMAELKGSLMGDMNVLGSLSEPVLDGYMQCTDAGIDMPLFGSRLTLSDNKIPVDSNVINLDGFKIYGSNKNAVNVTGKVDMTSMDNPKMNIRMNGRNVEFVNSKQQRKMEVFGKGYANIDVGVKGTMNDMNVDASLTLLPATNLTYVMLTDVSTIATQTDESMVKFVNFADTAEVEIDSLAPRATTSNFVLNAKLNIQQGSKFNVFLSNNGNDRVVIEGNGILNYYQSSLGDERLVGQYTIGSGYVKYTPPLLSEKLFDFVEGSYVSWTGNMMNPVLNLKAIDTMKATVSQEGRDSRSINFLVSLAVTNTLNNMDLAFDLSTNEDMTIQNELLSMAPSQRSSQAINMLLYGTYTGMGTSASTSAGNPLYSFLNSQINRWAANTIKGVDLTFGVNQYDKVQGDATSKSTSYSYKISKSLFNDRFKIVVGGSYDPSGDTDDNFANSLLNDISFVYMLNQSGTMSVKLFRHTGFESILEGEITETGGAFVMKRKASSFKQLFRFRKPKLPMNNKKEEQEDTIIKLEEAPAVRKLEDK